MLRDKPLPGTSGKEAVPAAVRSRRRVPEARIEEGLERWPTASIGERRESG